MLRRLQIYHYRALKYIDIRLSPFLILVGPNASGKSTLLDGLTLIQDILNKGPQSAIKSRSSSFNELLWKREGDRLGIAVELEIPGEVQEKLKDKSFSEVRYELSLQLDEKKSLTIGGENLWLIKKTEEHEIKKTKKERKEQRSLFPTESAEPLFSEIVSPRKWTPPGWRKIISRTASGNHYIRSEITEWNMTYKFGPFKAGLARIPEDEERLSVALWTKSILMEGIQFLQLNSTVMRRSCRSDSPVAFQPDGSNLPKVIEHLKNAKNGAFERWIKHVQTALPDINDIDVKSKEEDRSLYLTICYNNGVTVPSWLISDGTLRLLAQTIIAYLPEKNHIYLVEEPENGLHPLAIETIFQSLSSVYNNQILLVTHSPAILRLAEPKDILCFSKAPSGAVDIIRGENHPKLQDWRKGMDLATLHGAGILQ